MQVKGRNVVMVIFAVSVALSAYAWFHRYEESRRSATYWGPQAARLMAGNSTVTLRRFAPASNAEQASFDLTEMPGLVHLRHALTNDSSFEWQGAYSEPWSPDDWDMAFEFAKEGEVGRAYFRKNFCEVTPGAGLGPTCEVLPCARLGTAIRQYLGDVGVDLQAPLAAEPSAAQ